MAKKDRTGNRKTRAMIDKCLELTAYDAQYRIPWIVFDRDQVQGFDEIIAEAVSKGIQVGWSNPCFEIWMYAYFGSMPAIQDSWTCCSDFGRVYETKIGQKYSKADELMYGKLCKVGDDCLFLDCISREADKEKRQSAFCLLQLERYCWRGLGMILACLALVAGMQLIKERSEKHGN